MIFLVHEIANMETGTFVLALAWMAFLVQGAFSSPNVLQNDWLQVDCGATRNTVNSLTTWRTDEEFMEKGQGQNKLLTTTQNITEMNTLRFFPTGKENCYKFPVSYYPYPYSNHLYLIRAGFYYGNYDGLSKPPIFDLQFDNTLWTSVATNTSDEPIFHEVMYNVLSEELRVCLVQTVDDMVPFISSLQVIPIQFGVYDNMDTNTTAFYLQSRTRFGSDRQIGGLDLPDDDEYNRFWKPRSMPNYRPILPKFVPNGSSTQYQVPFDVLSYAIEATNLTDSIYIPIDFPSTTQSIALFIFYFSSIDERDPEKGSIRKVQIQIDGKETKLVEISPVYSTVEGAVFYPVSLGGGSANVTISAGKGADLPAMINAMEVYTTIQVSHATKSWNYNYYFILAVFLVIHLLVHEYQLE